jgi:hypothetical protein
MTRTFHEKGGKKTGKLRLAARPSLTRCSVWRRRRPGSPPPAYPRHSRLSVLPTQEQRISCSRWEPGLIVERSCNHFINWRTSIANFKEEFIHLSICLHSNNLKKIYKIENFKIKKYFLYIKIWYRGQKPTRFYHLRPGYLTWDKENQPTLFAIFIRNN